MSIIPYLKKNKLQKTYFTPLILLVILVVWCILIKIPVDRFILWLDTLGLFLLTIGAIFAIRPIIRILLNPHMKKRENILKRDVNAGLMAFHYFLSGFSMQFIAKFYILLGGINFGWAYSWFLISLIILIVAYVLFSRKLKEFKLI